MNDKGMVYLVGAGPGDSGLITVKGLECIRKAEVVVYDRLVNPGLLAEARSEAELIYVGKAADRHALSQDEINALLVRKAQEGKMVVRLKGGDPFVFGRGGEEAEVLVEAQIRFEIVPGVTSAVAVPAYAGIPVTHRDFASTLSIITGHEDPTKDSGNIDWAQIAPGSGTLVFLMGVGNLPQIVDSLVENGRPPDTPAAVIRWGTEPRQQTVTGVLSDIVEKSRQADIRPPAVTVVGEVVRLREKLRWFDVKPLFGKRVLVTRTREQASVLSAGIRELGGEPVELPTIRITPPEDFSPLDQAIRRLDSYDWVVFTSVNGVQSFMERLLALGRDVRALAATRLAAIGPVTAAALRERSLRVDFMPESYVAEAVAEGLAVGAGERVLLPRAELARPDLAELLRARDVQVDEVVAYRTLLTEPSREALAGLTERKIDLVTFTSSSTVRNLVSILREAMGAGWGAILDGALVACIGPITARTAAELGLQTHIVAEEYTIEGLLEAIVGHFRRCGAAEPQTQKQAVDPD